MKLLLKLWAKITGQKVVYTLDHDGEITLCLAFKTPFGWVTKRHCRCILLLPNGQTHGVSYVREWREG